MYQAIVNKLSGIVGDSVDLSGTIFINKESTIKYIKQTDDIIVLRIINLYDESYTDYVTDNVNPFKVSADTYFTMPPFDYMVRIVVYDNKGNVKHKTELKQFVITE